MDKLLEAEARHFDVKDIERHREITWSRLAAPFVSKTIYPAGNRNQLLAEIIERNTPGLALACGDMQQEAPLFKLARSSSVDAIDISKESLKKAKAYCKALGLNVKFSVSDVNKIKLPRKHYGLVVIAHSFHHFEEVDRIAEQIADSMLPNGVFILVDYIGPRYLQYTNRQLKYANEFFKELPPSLRIDHSGKVTDEVQPPLRWGLSVNEAIQSPKILPALQSNFCCIKGLLYGGLMYPVLGRIAVSFNPKNKKHAILLGKLWKLERRLINNLEIEPNFCELILVRKNSKLCRKYSGGWFKYRAPELDNRYDWLVNTSSKEIWRLIEKISEYKAAVKKRDDIIVQYAHRKSFVTRAANRLGAVLKK
ncbi:hypothetical protein A3F38_00110 [Candidatus Saccharibacteria bacterium RIFCSPHIGHO2_12_FULL_48_21]|nr:MAG: hypothetical protein A3F38_00110 [Candidatus Saccharibacteria bacterium RIFCSPHIGHO2_12_FULL_48_21]